MNVAELIVGRNYLYNDDTYKYHGPGRHRDWDIPCYAFEALSGRVYWLTENEVRTAVTEVGDGRGAQ